MFSTQIKKENGFQIIVLRDKTSGCAAHIVPEWSAMLQAFYVPLQGSLFNAVSSFSSANDFHQNVAPAGFKGCKLSPYAGRIKNGTYTFGESTYHLQKHYLHSDAMHGLLFDAPFQVVALSHESDRAYVILETKYRKEDPGYPFDYDCRITWELSSKNSLRVHTESINRDVGLIPMQDGWHPYFTLGAPIDDLWLEFQSMEVFETENMIPTGAKREYDDYNSLKKIGDTKFDHCFTLNLNTCQPMCVLRNPDLGIQVEIHPKSSYPYLQLFTPEDRQSLAIECMSAPPDAFNNAIGLQVLSPGESAHFEVMYRFTPLPSKEEI